jgi:N-succinyldiaminopimelate aminotransferase
VNPLYAAMPTTVFEDMSARARATGAISLGQGFPDKGWPDSTRPADAMGQVNGSTEPVAAEQAVKSGLTKVLVTYGPSG